MRPSFPSVNCTLRSRRNVAPFSAPPLTDGSTKGLVGGEFVSSAMLKQELRGLFDLFFSGPARYVEVAEVTEFKPEGLRASRAVSAGKP